MANVNNVLDIEGSGSFTFAKIKQLWVAPSQKSKELAWLKTEYCQEFMPKSVISSNLDATWYIQMVESVV